MTGFDVILKMLGFAVRHPLLSVDRCEQNSHRHLEYQTWRLLKVPLLRFGVQEIKLKYWN